MISGDLWQTQAGRMLYPGKSGDTSNTLPSAGISCEWPSQTRLGNRGAEKSSWSSKPIVAGDRGDNNSEHFGNGQPVKSIMSTAEVSFKNIRGINSESDHSGNSSTGCLSMSESFLVSTDVSTSPARLSVGPSSQTGPRAG